MPVLVGSAEMVETAEGDYVEASCTQCWCIALIVKYLGVKGKIVQHGVLDLVPLELRFLQSNPEQCKIGPIDQNPAQLQQNC